MQRSKINPRYIISIARIILIATAVSAGALVFYVMKNHAENLLRNSLQSSLENHVVLARTELRQGFEKSTMVATRPFIIQQIRLVDSPGHYDAAAAALQKAAQSFISTGLSAIALLDRHGREIVRAGHFLRQPELEVPLHFPVDTQLVYKGQFFLRTSVPIMEAKHVIGTVRTETPLQTLSGMFMQRKGLSTTSDLALCAATGKDMMQCFPTTLTHHISNLPLTSSKGTPFPMAYALDGKTGFIIAQDYRRQEVVAAYGPLDHLGLGMVLKIDSSELYAPVWSQLRYLLPLMIGLLGAALLSLRWLLAPLVNELAHSEREAHATNTRLLDSENRVRLLLDNVDEGIVSIASGGDIELFNPAAERIFKYGAAEALGQNVSMLMSEPSASEHDQYLKHYLQTGEAHVIGTTREVQARRSDGQIFPMEIRISEFSLNGERKFIGIMHDITERKAAEAEINHLAQYDALTDLPNRRLVQERMQQTLARARRTQARFAVMFIDLDRFKSINDELGHDTGDQLLQAVAKRLKTTLRGEDTVGRQGGDEFIVLLAWLNAIQDAALVARKILDALAEPFLLNGLVLHIGASIGIAAYPQDGDDVETLLKNSDTAMYAAKEAGRGTYRFFSQAMHSPMAGL